MLENSQEVLLKMIYTLDVRPDHQSSQEKREAKLSVNVA